MRTVACKVLAASLVMLTVSACGSRVQSMLDRDDSGAQQHVASNQNLTMPPDLRLPPPGSGTAPVTQTAPASYQQDGLQSAPSAPPANRPQYGDDVFAREGINVYKPDGTRKTETELREELRQAQLAKKKQKNPNYGTVFNMGNIFSDD